MIISNNRDPGLIEFKTLVDNVTLSLNNDAAKRPSYYLKRNAQLLEDDVHEFLNLTAKRTKFEGSIEKISGQRFPDIVAGKYYGVEVKSSKDEKWLSLGGSINESTRVEDVERIFITFGKLKDPVEFRSRPYEDCLSEVVVTHYPRYKIDMNLKDGETIFHKMNTTYDKLRKSTDPVESIVDYYRNQLSQGESFWWTGGRSNKKYHKPEQLRVCLLNSLPKSKRHELRAEGFALFPELLSASNDKYENFSLWLASKHSLVSSNIRDLFSARGKGKLETEKASYIDISRVILNVNEDKRNILKTMNSIHESILCKTWGVKIIENDRLGQWINLISRRCALKNYDIHKVMNSIFSRK